MNDLDMVKFILSMAGIDGMVNDHCDYSNSCECEDCACEEEVQNNYQYIITGDSITLYVNGEEEVVTNDNVNFNEIREYILDEDYKEALALMNVGNAITQWGSGLLQIEGDTIKYADQLLTGKLVDKIIGMMGDGDESFQKFAKFLNLVLENPSFKNRERLMDFAAAEDIELTDEGKMRCFKNVRDDYYDKHTGTFRYMVGDEPSMPRTMVDDRDENTCSKGLHAASINYLKGFWGTSGKTLIVEVDPKDVVSIPTDYNDSKLRTCKMKVVEDITDYLYKYGF